MVLELVYMFTRGNKYLRNYRKVVGIQG
jgi:hypothetical protein